MLQDTLTHTPITYSERVFGQLIEAQHACLPPALMCATEILPAEKFTMFPITPPKRRGALHQFPAEIIARNDHHTLASLFLQSETAANKMTAVIHELLRTGRTADAAALARRFAQSSRGVIGQREALEQICCSFRPRREIWALTEFLMEQFAGTPTLVDDAYFGIPNLEIIDTAETYRPEDERVDAYAEFLATGSSSIFDIATHGPVRLFSKEGKYLGVSNTPKVNRLQDVATSEGYMVTMANYVAFDPNTNIALLAS